MVSLKALQPRDCERLDYKEDYSNKFALQNTKLMIFLNLGTDNAF